MTHEMLFYSVGLFALLFSIGTLLSLILYKWQYRTFFRSTIWIKILYWIPIFICFLLVLYAQLWASVLVVFYIVGFAVREVKRVATADHLARLYAAVVSLASIHLVLFFLLLDADKAVVTLLLVGFSSVLSDVCAYFFGNFGGRHKLPASINDRKSWEGVGGQLTGSLIGYILIAPILHPAPSIALAAAIGVASATGDIINSIVKRRIGVIDWGTTIPGHGGVLDRFASLSFAIATAYWWVA